ncbi:MAG: hypothetical protein JSV03_00195 [Planctomycetota bacterium]|nr:MAG: hypothetical protein JSV03_00195 [Planctomycetota bacterium]
MWFSLFVVVLVLAITFYQGLQGLFSALISCILTILSAGLAFGFYEDIYFAKLIEYQPDHGRAIALLAVFILTLLVLRLLTDQLIVGNMHFPIYVDRAVGGLLGFVTAMIIVGMLAIGFQMLPFGSRILGFSRYALIDTEKNEVIPLDDPTVEETVTRASIKDWSKVKRERQSLWFAPDAFAAGLVSHLSNNSLAGRNRLKAVYPDFIDSLHRARAGQSPGSRMTVEPESLRIKDYRDLKPGELYVPERFKDAGKDMIKFVKRAEDPEVGMKRIAISAVVRSKAQDSDNVHRFTTEQVRLLAIDRKGGDPKEYFLSGINAAAEEVRYRLVQLYRGEGIVRESKEGNPEFTFVFEVPDKAEFTPLYLEYKLNARAEIRPSQGVSNQPSKASKASDEGSKKKKQNTVSKKSKSEKKTSPKTRPRRDRVSGIGASQKESQFSDKLPFQRALTDYNGSDIDVGSGVIRGGRVIAQLDNDWQPRQGNNAPIETFEVPEGKRLLQLSVEKLNPLSWLGQIMGGAVDKIGNIYLIDAAGKNYRPVGVYAIASVSGRQYFELIYLDEISRGMARLPKFTRIKKNNLRGDYSYYFLFHVPPGTRPATLNTGRNNIDLKPLNLVAR